MRFVGPEEVTKFKSLLVDYPFKPLRTYPRVSPEKEAEYLLSLCRNVASKVASGAVISVEKSGKPLGFLTLEELPWDSEIFAIPMARIAQIVVAGEYNQFADVYRSLFTSSLDYVRKRGVRYVSCQVDAQDIRGNLVLQELGFTMMDTIVVYLLDLDRWRGEKFQMRNLVREHKPEDIPALKKLARTAFTVPTDSLNRFIADPYLPDEKCGKFYEEWLTNSCNGSEADVVFVAEHEGKIVGFTTGKVHKEMSEILGIRYGSQSLSAVLATARHRGIYTDLAKALIRWMRDRADLCENKTQVTTIFIQRSYNRFGRTLVRSYHTFRKWLGETPPVSVGSLSLFFILTICMSMIK